MKIFTIANLPDEPWLQQQWLQHLRDFDTAHPGCHFEIGVEGAPDLTMAEMIERLRVEPELTFSKIFERMKTVDGDT